MPRKSHVSFYREDAKTQTCMTNFNMNQMKIKKMILILLFFTGVVSYNLFADPPDPPAPPNPGGSPVGTGNPVGAPIDGGVVFLLILGAGYGVHSIFSLNNKQKKLDV
jgi:hypothetical protein